MPTVRNCSGSTLSVWGRRNEKGHISGKELYLDDISPGGVAEFPRHGALVLRVPDASGKGERLAGPVHHPEFVISGSKPLELRITAGRRGRCARFTTMEVVLIVFCTLLGVMAVVVTVLMVLLRAQKGGGRHGRRPPPAPSPVAARPASLGPATRPLSDFR